MLTYHAVIRAVYSLTAYILLKIHLLVNDFFQKNTFFQDFIQN